MSGRIITHHPKITPEKLAEARKLRAGIEAEEPLKARAQAAFRQHELIKTLIGQVKEVRLRRNLSLDEVGMRSGIDKANLSRLETDATPNPTMATMLKYAEGVGVKLLLSVEA